MTDIIKTTSEEQRVSFHVAAYNAATTLAETLESLIKQTSPHWEAIIIDDGSTDATGEIATRYAARDPRFRIITQTNQGLSAARNVGIAASRGAWVACLDADDLIEPTYLETMTSALDADPSLDAVCCEFTRLAPDGSRRRQPLDFHKNGFFHTSGQMCPIGVNAVVLRKRLITDVGGFAPDLRVCNDWDMWQRIARTGAKFGVIHQPLAVYRMRPGSLSNQAARLLSEALQIIDRAHTSDDRVLLPDLKHARGLSPRHLATKKLHLACWAAGLGLGSGDDARPLLRLVADTFADRLDPESIANTLFEATLLPSALTLKDWPALLGQVSLCLDDFLIALEPQTGTARFARRTRLHLERRILEETERLCRVSFVIAAYNAAATLAETLDSVLAQTHRDWEAIVVNDGSADETEAIAQQYAARDPRVRVISQANGGVSAARNTGVTAARYEWIGCLDADDMIEPTYLESMTGLLRDSPEIDIAYCEFSRLSPDGVKTPQTYWFSPDDIFSVATRTCPFAAHGTLTRRSLMCEVGLFDVTLKTCEDWDMWQRIARTGATFGVIEQPLAVYRMRPGSASNDGRQVLADAVGVIERGHAPDPRVGHPYRLFALGEHPRESDAKKIEFTSWAAGLALGNGKDARPLLAEIADTRCPFVEAEHVAHTLFQSCLPPRGLKPSDWPALIGGIGPDLDAFLAAFETHTGTIGLAVKSRRALERLILENNPTLTTLICGSTYAARVEATAPISDVSLPLNIDRAHLAISIEGVPIGGISLPVIDGRLSGYVVSDAIAAAYAWEFLAFYLGHTIYPHLQTPTDDNGVVSILRHGVVLDDDTYFTEDDPEESEFWSRAHDRIGWTVFLQELWNRPGWTDGKFQSVRTPDRPARHIHVRDRLTVEIIEDLPNVLVTGKTLDITVTAVGCPLLTFAAPAGTRQVSAQELRAWITNLCGMHLCRFVVRECLLGKPIEATGTLRGAACAALRDKRQQFGTPPTAADHLEPDAWRERARAEDVCGQAVVVTRRDAAQFSWAALRRAVLPGSVMTDLLAAFDTGTAENRPGVFKTGVADDPPRLVLYAPDVLSGRPSGLTVLPNLATPDAPLLHGRDTLFKRVRRKAQTVWATRAARSRLDQSSETKDTSNSLPILMYHRIADDGAEATARWRTTPGEFEEQLAWLQHAGYRSVTCDEWQTASTLNRPLPARGVWITFDDGYVDFETYAWPLLQRYGFTATVFLVADRIGRTSDWDTGLGEEVPLMDWDSLRRMQAQGVHFGSHTVSHPHLTALSIEEATREMARSRLLLQRGLECPITAIAYPHGDSDPIISHLAGACGYNVGVTTEPGQAALQDDQLALTRVEIEGSTPMNRFISLVSAEED